MSKVIHGKNGYLFLIGNQNAVIKLHTGERYLDSRQLKNWEYLFNERKNRLESANIILYLQIVPDKHCVYSQFLPEKYNIVERRNIHLFLERITPILNNRMDYPLSAIVKESSQQQVYFKKDSHWTDRGAYIAYSELMTLVKIDFNEIYTVDRPSFKPRYFKGDLARLLNVEHDDKGDFFQESSSIKIHFDNKVRNTGRIIIFHNEKAINSKRILVFGSSSSLNTVKFLAHDFTEVILCWSGNYDYSIINSYKPDILINQIRERHLIRPANDLQGLTTTEMAFVKSYTEVGEGISPFLFNDMTLLKNCLVKAGNRSNKSYLKYLQPMCEKLNIDPVYTYALSINHQKVSMWLIKLMIGFRLLLTRVSSGSIKLRLNQTKRAIHKN